MTTKYPKTVADEAQSQKKIYSEPVQSFIIEQFNKLSLERTLGLNSKVKRTFARP